MAEDQNDRLNAEHARSLLRESEVALRDVLDALDILRARIRAGDDVPPAELSRALTAFSQARTRLTEEVTRHEDRILLATKRVASAPLDFDELRASLGRKIDRIRADLDAGAVPEGAGH